METISMKTPEERKAYREKFRSEVIEESKKDFNTQTEKTASDAVQQYVKAQTEGDPLAGRDLGVKTK